MVAALILAAGSSTRMGRPKALLADPDGRPFVARLVRTFASAGVENVVVVTGDTHKLIVETVLADGPPSEPRFARNTRPAGGQISSLRVGLDAVGGLPVQALLVGLVDVPMVAVETVSTLVEAWRHHPSPIIRPVMGERHGHPVLFDRSVFHQLRTVTAADGAKAVLRAHADDLIDVTVTDPGCMFDIDTPADYETLLKSPAGDGRF